MNIFFSGALGKDSKDPDTCLRKAMTNVKNKQNKKSEILTIIVP